MQGACRSKERATGAPPARGGHSYLTGPKISQKLEKRAIPWYNPCMNQLDLKILEALRGPNPPQSPREMILVLGLPRDRAPNMYNRISVMLRERQLKQSEIPWRQTGAAHGGGRPRGVASGFSDIAKAVSLMARGAAKDADKLSALKFLSELRQLGGETSGPPAPEDHAGTVAALARILMAAGPKATTEAALQVWQSACVILIPEVQHAQSAAVLDGPAAS